MYSNMNTIINKLKRIGKAILEANLFMIIFYSYKSENPKQDKENRVSKYIIQG